MNLSRIMRLVPHAAGSSAPTAARTIPGRRRFNLHSIKAKVLAAMLIVVAICASPLLVEYAAMSRILGRVDALIGTDVPFLTIADDLSISVQRIVASAQSEILEDRVREHKRKGIFLDIEAARAALLELGEVVVDVSSQIKDIDADLVLLKASVTNVFAGHDVRLGFTFVRGGHSYTADIYAAKLKYDFADRMRKLSLSLYLAEDAQSDEIERWLANYHSEDGRLQTLLKRLSAANTQAMSMIAQLQRIPPASRTEFFESNRAAVSQPLDSAFDQIIAYMAPLLESAQDKERDDIQAVEAIAERVASRASDLRRIARASFDEARGAVQATGDQSALVALAAGLAAVLIGIVGALLLTRNLAAPIASVVKDMERIASGDFEVRLAAAVRADEIGDMSRLVGVFRDNGLKRAELETGAAVDGADRAQRQERIELLIGDFDSRISTLAGSLGAGTTQMEQTALALTDISAQAQTHAAAVASASDEAATNVQTVATSCEQLSASIEEIAARVARANDLVVRADIDSQGANGRVAALADSASRISTIIGVIGNIAGQTSLLALNATIEAARAGETGRGFAVVAAEVKALSAQTARATDEIGAQIRAIQDETEGAVQSIQGIAALMAEVAQQTSAIAAAVEEQGAATNEISRNVRAAANGTIEVSRNMSGVNAASEKTSQSADHVLETAASLAGETASLRSEVDRFLAEVRAA